MPTPAQTSERPYQIVFATTGAPVFLETFSDLEQALSVGKKVSRTKNLRIRVVKWGGRAPCVPCGQKIRDNRLPGYRVVQSKGALEGYPEAMPLAEFKPNGEKMVFGPNGEGKVVGQANYIVSAKPFPIISKPAQLPKPLKYLDAVQSAQYLAARTGHTAYLCSSTGSDCNHESKQWVPVVYVEPGGMVTRYPHDSFGPGAIENSTNVVSSVSDAQYRELVAESRGGSYL